MQPAPVEPGVLGARLRQQQLIEDPQYGEHEPLQLEARSALWPHAAQWALIELVQITDGGARRLEEYRFTPANPAAEAPAYAGPGLPVAVLFERTPNGASRARLYSIPALRSQHPRSLRADARLSPGRSGRDALAALTQALQAADVTAAAALFEQQGSLQESSGALRLGGAQISAALARLMTRGATEVQCCTRVDEGARSALELQIDEWPALMVCERGEQGLLRAVRLYG